MYSAQWEGFFTSETEKSSNTNFNSFQVCKTFSSVEQQKEMFSRITYNESELWLAVKPKMTKSIKVVELMCTIFQIALIDFGHVCCIAPNLHKYIKKTWLIMQINSAISEHKSFLVISPNSTLLNDSF